MVRSLEPPLATSSGPIGCGLRQRPTSLHRYSPASPQLTTSTSSIVPSFSGSNLTCILTDCPSQPSAASTAMVFSTSKKSGFDTSHVSVSGALLKRSNENVSVWWPPSGASKRSMGSLAGGRALSLRPYLYVPSSAIVKVSCVSFGGAPVASATSGRYSTWKVPSVLPCISPSCTSCTSGSSHVHHSSGNVSGMSAGSGLSIVMSRRATCRIELSSTSVSITPGAVTVALMSWKRYSPVSTFVKVTRAPAVPSL
mmetsp:Transcript_40944/g.94365  ORF Transcript_40944/g.94365 Transcript_40944/m.94365 type:complete len:254 (-) Transcript_40944:2835-3596(-)